MRKTQIILTSLLILLLLGSTSSLVALASDISGDDYDWAAVEVPELSIAAQPEAFASSVGISYSGDDDYDLAAGGAPELTLLAFSGGLSLADACSLSDDAVAAHSAGRSFSGDDAYDYAAGGVPDAAFC
jgi:hypothetical protein